MENTIHDVGLHWKDDVNEKITGEINPCEKQIKEICEHYRNLDSKTD